MRCPHVTVITRRPSNDALGSRFNLCGTEPADRDVVIHDFYRMHARAIAVWNICPACVAEARRTGTEGRAAAP